MKKTLILILVILISQVVKSQIKISELPTSAGNPDSVWAAVVDGSVTKKIRGYKFARNKVDSITISSYKVNYWTAGVKTAVDIPKVDNSHFSNETSSYLFTGDIVKTSDSVAVRWRDDAAAISIGNKLFLAGGWHLDGDVGLVYSDSVYVSEDNGSTWSFWPHPLPFSGDGFVTFSVGGYVYFIGASNHNPSLQETVFRTTDMITFETRTTSAGWGSRWGLGACADPYGNLWVLGGQKTDSISIAANPNDVWKSTDFGISWIKVADHINVDGTYFLGQTITRNVQFINDRIVVAGGGMYAAYPYDTRSNKVYSASIDDMSTWRSEDSIPSSGKIWASTAVWDGKLWSIAGSSHEEGNNNTMLYMDKGWKWHDFPYTYTDNDPTHTIDVTHATNVTVHNDMLFRISGNECNKSYALKRSNYMPSVIIRNSFKANSIVTNSLKDTAGNDFSIRNDTTQKQIAGAWLNGVLIVGNGSTTKSGNDFQVDGIADISSRLGVGVTSPAIKLHVKDGSGAAQIRTEYDASHLLDLNVDASNNINFTMNSINDARAIMNFRQIGVGGTGSQFDAGAAGGGYPFWGFNVKAGNSANNYAARYTDNVILAELGRGNAFRINVGSGTAGNVPTLSELFTIHVSTLNVGINNSSPDASAILDVASTTKGFLPPRMTATQASAIPSPGEGLLVYVTNTNGTFTAKGWWGYNGSTWEKLNN